MNNFLEKYRDDLSIVKPNNPFLNVTKVSLNQLDNLINHKLWFRRKMDFDIVEGIGILEKIDKKRQIIYFTNNIEINYKDLIGVEDLSINYNKENLDFKKFVGKKVKMTNKYDHLIDSVIQSVEEDLICFAVRLSHYETLSYDLSYPINLLKEIEIM